LTFVRITLCINNLQPTKYKELNAIIEQLISHCILLWGKTLLLLGSWRPYHRRIPYTEATYDPDPGNWPEEDQPHLELGENEDCFGGRFEKWWADTKEVVLSERGEFKSPAEDEYSFDLRKLFVGLRIIVGLANIYDSWHIEGQLVSWILFIYRDSQSCPLCTLERAHLCDGLVLLLQREHYYKSPCLPSTK